MERQQQTELAAVQQQLLALERNRLHPHRRDLFWDAGQWQAVFAHTIECEQQRDHEYAQYITSVPVGSSESLTWLQALYDAIEHDLIWHQSLLAEVQAAQQSAGQIDMTQQIQQECFVHEASISSWAHARNVRLQQVALEFLEGRRRAHGALSSEVWQRYWQQLQHAKQLQSEHWRELYGQPLPQTVVKLRLEWYKQLRDVQKATRLQWRYERGFDHQSWQQDRSALEQEIRSLEPRRRVLGVLLSVVALGIVVVLIASLSWRPAPTTANTFTRVETAAPQLSASDINQRGLVLLVRGDCAAAIPLFRQAAALDPMFYQPPNNLAFCLYDQGDIPSAITYWRRSIELNAANADGYAGLGMALYTTGDAVAGQAEYQTAIRLNPKYSDEAWLRDVAKWSNNAISASSPLRLQASR